MLKNFWDMVNDACFKNFQKFQTICVFPDHNIWTKFIKKTVHVRQKMMLVRKYGRVAMLSPVSNYFFGELSIMRKRPG